MVVMSARERAARRGGMSGTEMVIALHRLGFVSSPTTDTDPLSEFTHPDTGARRYSVSPLDTPLVALDRIYNQMCAARHRAGVT